MGHEASVLWPVVSQANRGVVDFILSLHRDLQNVLSGKVCGCLLPSKGSADGTQASRSHQLRRLRQLLAACFCRFCDIHCLALQEKVAGSQIRIPDKHLLSRKGQM